MDYHLGASGKGLCRDLMRRLGRVLKSGLEPGYHLLCVGICLANTDSHRMAEDGRGVAL